ncbi:MAG: hypothetical protein IPK26_29230 [Planctomycetes bacterium]|nr:hypothetical protein [Planctomycetota bacterium]
MNVRSPQLLALLLAGTAMSCVRITYGRIRLEEPIADAQLQALRPDQATLAQCLRELGAPHFAWEYQGSGMALGWVWQDKDDFGLDVSYTIYKDTPGASFSYGREAADLPGCVLWFDAELTLRRWQRGTMGDLTRDLRQRPAMADE